MKLYLYVHSLEDKSQVKELQNNFGAGWSYFSWFELRVHNREYKSFLSPRKCTQDRERRRAHTPRGTRPNPHDSPCYWQSSRLAGRRQFCILGTSPVLLNHMALTPVFLAPWWKGRIPSSCSLSSMYRQTVVHLPSHTQISQYILKYK